jgi:hypothetical protein
MWNVPLHKKHLIFVNFGVRNFTVESNKKKTLMFEQSNCMDPMERGVKTVLIKSGIFN